MPQVITYQSPTGQVIRVTPAQEQYMERECWWPRDSRGEEYCQVRHGLHSGTPTWTDEELRALHAEAIAREDRERLADTPENRAIEATLEAERDAEYDARYAETWE